MHARYKPKQPSVKQLARQLRSMDSEIRWVSKDPQQQRFLLTFINTKRLSLPLLRYFVRFCGLQTPTQGPKNVCKQSPSLIQKARSSKSVQQTRGPARGRVFSEVLRECFSVSLPSSCLPPEPPQTGRAVATGHEVNISKGGLEDVQEPLTATLSDYH